MKMRLTRTQPESPQQREWSQHKSLLKKAQAVHQQRRLYNCNKKKSDRFNMIDSLLSKAKSKENPQSTTNNQWSLKSNKRQTNKKKLKLKRWEPREKLHCLVCSRSKFQMIVVICKLILLHRKSRRRNLRHLQRLSQRRRKMTILELPWG